MAKNVAPMASEIAATMRVTLTISFWSGLRLASTVVVRLAILPNSVRIPVAKTTARPCPDKIVVPANTRFGRSSQCPSSTGSAVRRFGCDSPVNAAVSTRIPLASMRRASAGTRPPSSKMQHVAGHKFAPQDFDGLPAACHPGVVRQQTVERLDSSFRFVFLQKGKNRIDDDDAQDGPAQGGHALARLHEVGGKGETGGDPQQDGEEVGELASKSAQYGVSIGLGQNVRTELPVAVKGFLAREAAAGCFEPLQHVLRREPVDVVISEVRHAHPARSIRNKGHVSADFQTRSRDEAVRSSSKRVSRRPSKSA